MKMYVPLLCLSSCFLLGRREARRLRRHHSISDAVRVACHHWEFFLFVRLPGQEA
jgi:hypothetical protein